MAFALTFPGNDRQNQAMNLEFSPHAVRREQEMKFGAQITTRGVRFRLWAPHTDAVAVRIFDPSLTVPMERLPRGWFEVEVEGVGAGTRYMFALADGRLVPDPASRFQPEDVHGPSEVIDPLAFAWTDRGWRGRPWEETILYELHVGTFTPQGTFRTAIERLDHLVELGVTAIELMPVAEFPGRWNWGYDGALLFAPDAAYGRPEDLKALVNAAHERGLIVFLDVVYNHFGPEGNYLTTYAPAFTEQHHTPWGAAINYDDDGAAMMRAFAIANARYWLNEYRFDGLRFDAVHEIRDNGPKHLLQDLAEQVRAATDGRHIHLVAENAANQAGWLRRGYDGTPGLYTAQWADDVHHALHAIATGESHGFLADFAGRVDLLGRALAEGLAWQGEYMPHQGVRRGEPSAYLPPTAFVSFLQNHDQIGNRPGGERISALVPPEVWRMMAAILLLSPQVPLLFMGEEWAATQPFFYFSDLQSLADSIRESRQKEFAFMPGWGPDTPDPLTEAAVQRSTLDWSVLANEPHRQCLARYRALIDVRRRRLVPRLVGMSGHSGTYEVIGGRGVRVRWILGDGSHLSLVANPSAQPIQGVELPPGECLWLEGTTKGRTLGPWSAIVILLAADGEEGG